MKKKLLTILLSVSLVLAFASTGVFAGSFSDFPSNGSPVYSVPYGKYFFKIVKSSILSSDPDNPTYLLIIFALMLAISGVTIK